MYANRKIAVLTGVVFIIATVAALVAAPLVPVLTGTDYLARLAANANQVAVAALFYLIAAFGSAGIAVVMYPVLKEQSASLALGSVVFRTMEAVMYLVGTLCLLTLVAVGQQFTAAGAGEAAWLQAIGNVVVSLRDHATLAGVFAFSLGGGLYYYLFLQTRLIPRWLSGWGLVAAMLMLTACVLSLFSNSPVTGYALLIVPIALQEMVLAVWLIAKGFKAPTVAPAAAAVGANARLSAA